MTKKSSLPESIRADIAADVLEDIFAMEFPIDSPPVLEVIRGNDVVLLAALRYNTLACIPYQKMGVVQLSKVITKQYLVACTLVEHYYNKGAMSQDE